MKRSIHAEKQKAVVAAGAVAAAEVAQAGLAAFRRSYERLAAGQLVAAADNVARRAAADGERARQEQRADFRAFKAGIHDWKMPGPPHE